MLMCSRVRMDMAAGSTFQMPSINGDLTLGLWSSLTRWSDDPSEGSLGLKVCGRWVGNGFDIVHQARLFRDIKAGSEMWVDVS